MRINDIGIDNAQELLDLVGSALDLGPEVLERIAQAEPHYFSDAREELLKALLEMGRRPHRTRLPLLRQPAGGLGGRPGDVPLPGLRRPGRADRAARKAA